MARAELKAKVEAVKAHALEHYEEKSWSYLVEAWSDWEIAEMVQYVESEAGAIRKAAEWVNLHHEVAEDIRNA